MTNWEIKYNTENQINYDDIPFIKRFMIYQKTRFPLISYGILILVVTISSYLYICKIYDMKFEIVKSIVIYINLFFIFLGLRICDEFKDYEDDKKYRPYRPVIVGIVKLKELRLLAIIGVIIQLLLLVVSMNAIITLLVVFVYMILMLYEFFISEYLKKHIVIYLLCHIVIMPLIILLIGSITLDKNMFNASLFLNKNMLFLMALAYFNGIVLEIGRKIRNEKEEENGVDTYSKIFGKKKALIYLSIILSFQQVLALLFLKLSPYALLMLFVICIYQFFNFVTKNKSGKIIEKYSIIWMFAIYLTILFG